jgi:hypothetical protein
MDQHTVLIGILHSHSWIYSNFYKSWIEVAQSAIASCVLGKAAISVIERQMYGFGKRKT